MSLYGRTSAVLLIAGAAFAQQWDTGPILRVKTRPRCTEQAQRQSLQGIVKIRVSITAKGDVSETDVHEGIGFGMDKEAVRSVKRWKFTPAMKDGKAVPSAAIVQVNCECQNSRRE